VSRDQLDRVRVPVGLDLGKTTHQEIAVAILAELVQLRASGALAGDAPPAAASHAAETVDPVCGMTVTPGQSGRPLEHDGVTYHFCGPGCRAAFEKDPGVYVKRETRC
jgi:xanthine dehydrogenase accessory factor